MFKILFAEAMGVAIIVVALTCNLYKPKDLKNKPNLLKFLSSYID